MTKKKWLILLLVIAWAPVLGAEALRHFTTNYQVVGFGFAWGIVVAPILSLAALIFVVLLVRESARNHG